MLYSVHSKSVRVLSVFQSTLKSGCTCGTRLLRTSYIVVRILQSWLPNSKLRVTAILQLSNSPTVHAHRV